MPPCIRTLRLAGTAGSALRVLVLPVRRRLLCHRQEILCTCFFRALHAEFHPLCFPSVEGVKISFFHYLRDQISSLYKTIIQRILSRLTVDCRKSRKSILHRYELGVFVRRVFKVSFPLTKVAHVHHWPFSLVLHGFDLIYENALKVMLCLIAAFKALHHPSDGVVSV